MFALAIIGMIGVFVAGWIYGSIILRRDIRNQD